MRAVVVDASVFVSILTEHGTRGVLAAEAVRHRDLRCPALVRYEVLQALRRLEAGDRLDARESRAAVDEFMSMSIDLAPIDAAVERIWQLRANITAYDASYVALAEQLDVPLITLDRRLAQAPGIRCEVVVPGG